MASPSLQNGAPNTPPPTDPASKNGDAKPIAAADVPLTSADDDGSAKRPRDARLLHVVLHNLGVQQYQERVPLQLLDFAYRYTSSILLDAQRLSSEGYGGQPAEKKRGGAGANTDDSSGITVTSLRQAISSRQGSCFENAAPKEFMFSQAAERNRISLPKVERGYGVQLPEEKYCLTGVGWGLKEEWDEDPEEDAPTTNGDGAPQHDQSHDQRMGGMDGADEDEQEDDEGAGKLEDVFGEEAGDGNGMDES
ncbi:hypothetical protein AMS68_002563 [Peltaster fructicola]|uniref:Transcription initiation factor TFIID subunit 9 n=1 Tax=Peltaster fructicola TaxID=286661 RepID=A0A6H0XQT1_9PEZI|nr:hypothetical protein AMS68_002563 [Peltaster fructicola]